VHLSKGRILVSAGPRIVEIAGPERVRQLLAAPNVVAIRKRRTGAIVAIQLLEYGDDSRLRTRDGNPQKLSHCHETPENPPRVWTFKPAAVECFEPDTHFWSLRRIEPNPTSQPIAKP
jgi:hypothetical protein